MSLRGVNFYLSRLRQASLPELVHRLNEAFFLRKAKQFARSKKFPFIVPDVPDGQIEELKLPDMVLNNNHNTANEIQTDAAIIQFEDKFTHTLFSDIKPDDAIDIRAVWEPARLQSFTSLLINLNDSGGSYCETNKEDAKNTVLRWLDSNPFLFGPHYMSAMECGLRIPVFLYCLKGLDTLAGNDRLCLLTAIYKHAWWVSHRLSLYSSLGNHTIAEAVGLIFAGAIFRGTKEGKTWLDKGYDLLTQELNHQILDDGGPAEQSLSYHRFVLDLYWLSADFLATNGLKDCSAWKPRLIEGEKFFKSFVDGSGNMPSIGDSDDGHAIAPGIHPKRSGDDFAETRPCVTFPESGYTILRGINGLVLTFDHGPLGMVPLYNHGHADALSITLSIAGEQILVDPGTYRYNGVPEWRQYFKGTRAHNTVTIDGKDQAIQETGFIWSHPYRTELLRSIEQDDLYIIEARHDGYGRLKNPVIHGRLIIFLEQSNFIIKDTFSGRGLHDFELNYHLHPDAVVSNEQGWWEIQKGNAQVFIALIGGEDFKIIRGQNMPILGWYSQAYGMKRECSALSHAKRGCPDEVSFLSVICAEMPIEKDKIESILSRVLKYE